jgi:hypothetical protein
MDLQSTPLASGSAVFNAACRRASLRIANGSASLDWRGWHAGTLAHDLVAARRRHVCQSLQPPSSSPQCGAPRSLR